MKQFTFLQLHLWFLGQIKQQFHSFSGCYTFKQGFQNNLYRKPFSGNILLCTDSGHPTHVIQGIPVGQLLRLQRICSENEEVDREKREMMGERFQLRGYNTGTLCRAMGIVDTVHRENIFAGKKTTSRIKSRFRYFLPHIALNSSSFLLLFCRLFTMHLNFFL